MVNVIPGIHRRMNVLKVTKYVVFYSAKQFTRKMLITQGLVLRQKCATLSELWYSELLKLWQGVIQKELCLLFYLEKKDTCRERKPLFLRCYCTLRVPFSKSEKPVRHLLHLLWWKEVSRGLQARLKSGERAARWCSSASSSHTFIMHSSQLFSPAADKAFEDKFS